MNSIEWKNLSILNQSLTPDGKSTNDEFKVETNGRFGTESKIDDFAVEINGKLIVEVNERRYNIVHLLRKLEHVYNHYTIPYRNFIYDLIPKDVWGIVCYYIGEDPFDYYSSV